MKPTPNLRVVMTAEEYRRERQLLRDMHGDAEASLEALGALRDQRIADLFQRSGWTQEQIAQEEGKSRIWVVYRLRLGRFLAHAADVTDVTPNLTEGRFRSYWEQTDKALDEPARFDAVVRLMSEPPPAPEPRPKVKYSAHVTDAVRATVRPIIEAGQRVNQGKLSEELGVSEQAVKLADFYERGRIEGLQEAVASAPIDTAALSKSAQERFDALVRRQEAQFEMQVQAEVTARLEQHWNEYLLPTYGERLRERDMLMQRAMPFTNDEFRRLLACMHPDCQNLDQRAEAFELLKSRQVLLREPRAEELTGLALPRTIEELLARKAQAAVGRRKRTKKASA